jgi:hypothetical protein
MALEGNLRDMALADLLQVFWMGSKTGILLLIAGPERGVIYVRDGRLIDAVLARGPRRQVVAAAEDAVIHMLQWQDARFTFRPHPTVVGRPVRIVRDHAWLVAEGVRRSGPLHALPLDRITPDTQLRLAALPGRAESGVNLNLDQWRILSRLANIRNVRDICEEISLEFDQAIHLVAELVVFGLVEIILPSPAHEA